MVLNLNEVSTSDNLTQYVDVELLSSEQWAYVALYEGKLLSKYLLQNFDIISSEDFLFDRVQIIDWLYYVTDKINTSDPSVFFNAVALLDSYYSGTTDTNSGT